MAFLRKLFSKKDKKNLDQGLYKTKKSLFSTLTSFFSTPVEVGAKVYEQLEEILIGADIGVDTTIEIIRRIERRIQKEKVTRIDTATILSLLKDETMALVEQSIDVSAELSLTEGVDTPQVIMIIGVNGAGKTTTIGKLAHQFATDGKKVILGAGDTFRAAAVEQLDTWASRANVQIVKQQTGADPASVAFDTVKAGVSRDADICMVDTAGRLHTQKNLMQELAKIKRVIGKAHSDAPHHVWLVLDGSTGQNARIQAQHFEKEMGITGLIITKLDGTAKGGAVISIIHTMNIPVVYIGIGEGIEQIQPFDYKSYIETLFVETE